ncbi:hypothetical protein L3V86_03685 [Thiotrichales bacterium 19S11-10]|nr:hypothetical protein [Thiotrichales bacterium 19S11-10]
MKKLLASILIISPTFYSPAFAQSTCDSLTASSQATELSDACKPEDKSCTIDSVYKISKTTGSLSSLLPPIKITAGGSLCIIDDLLSTPIDVYAQSFWVDGGTFQIGTKNKPISNSNKVTIIMSGHNSEAMAPMPLCKESGSDITCSAIANTSSTTPNARDITVTHGGKLLFYGRKGLTKDANDEYIHDLLNGQTFSDCYTSNSCKTSFNTSTNDLSLDPYFNTLTGSNSWTYLSMPAGASFYSKDNWVEAPVDYSNLKLYTDVSLTNEAPSIASDKAQYFVVLAKDVSSDNDTGWQKNDWISISTTSFSSHQTEIVQICDIYYTKNLEQNTNVYSNLINDPFYTGKTVNHAQYMQALNLDKPVTVIRLAGKGCQTNNYQSEDTGTPLKHYHYGGLIPTPGFFTEATTYTNSDGTSFDNVQQGQAYSFYDGALRNFGIDERAEVALLSRNIQLTSTAGDKSQLPEGYPSNQYFGGHLAVMNHQGSEPSEQVHLIGVEIEKFGQPLVGRYPVHFHRLNASSSTEDPNLIVQDTSVHHSYDKCFVPHATMGIKFYNNVCVRTIGQGFYLEDGYMIEDNHFVRNLVAGVMGASLDYLPYSNNSPLPAPGNGFNLFWSGDYKTNDQQFVAGNYDPSKIPDTSNSGANTDHPIDSLNPNGFWITNFGGKLTPNLFVNNSVAGCQIQGRGYWIIKQSLKSEYAPNGFPKQTSYPVFQGNRAHGCYAGLDTDARMDLGVSNETTSAPYPVSPAANVNDQALAPGIIFNDLTFTRIRYKAFWTRSLFSILLNSRFAANKQGITILGGGGPEGNLLGFWGLVKDNVIAGITNNNVDRFYDCNYHMSTQASSMDALAVENYNESSECVAFSSTPLTGDDASIYTKKQDNTVNAIMGEGSAVNGNLQGYTYYDGPARMEDTRFINFRIDATSQVTLEGQKTRYMSTRVDARKMLDLNRNINQFGLKLYGQPGGLKHFGYVGDPAMAWIKGNSQSLPPTQYALNNIWDNTDFKHQVFTETVNMNDGISDGDKQTIILDKDATLAGYKVCNSTGCNEQINHFPISLNNLNFYGTPYTVDEPDAIGRNNVIASAMMSPHKYATINIETSPAENVVAAPKSGALGNEHFNLRIIRDMNVYQNKVSDIYLYGRGGMPIFETFFMNNMGYTIYPQNNAKSTAFAPKLLLSYSDAPVDSLFINRIGICLGKNAQISQVGRVLRQWGDEVRYLGESPYISQMQHRSNCTAIFKDTSKWNTCNSYAKPLSQGSSLANINNEFVSLSALKPGNEVKQSYYFDQSTGILYFNMVQLGDSDTVAQTNPITPPYALCNNNQDIQFNGQSYSYQTAFSDYKAYKMFSNTDNILSSLQAACFFPRDKTKTQAPQNSSLINCPREGCVSYTVEFSNGDGNCSTPSTVAQIIEPTKVDISKTKVSINSSNQLVYASPYWLKQGNTMIQPRQGEITIQGYYTDTIKGTQNFYFNCDQDIKNPSSNSKGLLPVSTLLCSTNNQATIGKEKGEKPSDLTKWTLSTGGGTSATITGANFAGEPPAYAPKSSINVPKENGSESFFIQGAYPHNVSMEITTTAGSAPGKYSCDNVKLNSGGKAVDISSCSSGFTAHFKFTPSPNANTPATLIAQP